ncbi:MAG: MgtC/SapB family protein [Anaerolineae bacterium]|nr:MgtC/SapB family protein [Anaerolineae bacterium]
MAQSELFYRFGVALVLGILVGLERQYSGEAEHHFGGIRTFAFISLLGCASAMIATEYAVWFFPLAFIGLAAMVLASYVATSEKGDVGLTTEITSLLVFLCGALAYWGYLELGAALAVIVTLFLSLKVKLHTLAARISQEDILATLKFAIITVIVLPILPNRTYGPLDVLNPYNIWLMVVFISAINFIGYVLVKVLGSQHGIGLTGLLGGLVSSTAVTLSFSQRSQKEPVLGRDFALAITVASTTMFLRVLFEAYVLNQVLAYSLLVPLLAAAGVGLAACLYLWFSSRSRERGEVSASNPFELGPAVQFGLLFAVILFVSKAAQVYLGDAGVYLSSVLAGLTDVDAITLSMARLAGADVSYAVAARAVTLAALSNTVVKGGIAISLGSASLRRYILPIFGAVLVVGVATAFLLVG